MELAETVAAETGDPSLGEKLSESWGAYLKPAAYRGRLCFAADRGRNVCFTRPDRSALLVQGFDQWVVGAARGEAALLDQAQKARVYRQAGWISAALLVNGRIEGVWRHERKGKRLAVELEPFGKLPAWARRGAEQEAERLRDFPRGRALA